MTDRHTAEQRARAWLNGKLTVSDATVARGDALARDVLALVAEVEQVTRELDALLERYEPDGYISTAQKVIEERARADAAEVEAAGLRERNQQLRDALGRAVKTLEHAEKWAPVHPSYLGEAANAARAALGDGEQQ